MGSWYGSVPDDLSNSARSTLVVREDGVALGPAHTLHEQIRAGGRGAFSHWGSALIFSSSDGTDPRTNGRLYTVEAPVQLRSEVISGALALFLICAVGLYVLQRARAPTARDRLSFHTLMLGVTILLAGIVWRDTYAMSSFDPLLSWDSISFLTGSTFRGFAYTTLLNASIWLLPSGRLLVPLQLTLLIISFATVGWSVARVTSNSLLGWLTTVVLLVDTRLTRFSLFMLSDAIFIALVAFHFAALLSVIRRPSTAATVRWPKRGACHSGAPCGIHTAPHDPDGGDRG